MKRTNQATTFFTLSVFGVVQLGRKADRRDRRAEPKFCVWFYGGMGTNSEACELNFGAAQVIMRNGVCKGTNTSFCHPLSVSEPSCDIKPYYRLLVGLYTVHNSWKALKMPFFSKTGSRNMAETCAIDFSYPTCYSTSVPIGGLSALLLPCLMWAGPDFENLAQNRQSAVFAFFPNIWSPFTEKVEKLEQQFSAVW